MSKCNQLFSLLCSLPLLLLPAAASAQLTINAPTAENKIVASGSDYATDVLNDPWDMNSRGDLAEFIPSADYGGGLTSYKSYSFLNGIFSFDINQAAGAYFYLLSPGQPSTNPLGKNGQRLPIDSTKYRYLNIMMKTDTPDNLFVIWHTGKSHGGNFVRTVAIPTVSKWRVYTIDLETIASSQTLGENRTWSQAEAITALALYPGTSGRVQIDWITLTSAAPATYPVDYSFSAQGTHTQFSLWVDSDSDPSNGYYLDLVENSGAAAAVTLDPTVLAPGQYKICGFTTDPGSSANSAVTCSPGALVVNQAPLLKVIQPDAKGGADFAATVLGNPWNMDSMDDIESVQNLQTSSIVSNSVVNGKQGDFFCATNANGDPIQTSLAVAAASAQAIDASVYKNVTFEAYVDGEQDIVNGSMLRIIGRNEQRDSFFFNGDDTVIQSQDSEWFSLTQDMTKFALEPIIHPDGSYPVPFWTGNFNFFRVDIHERAISEQYCINSIEVRADDQANSQFALAFDAPDSDSAAASVAVSFYYVGTEKTSGGQAIVTDLTLDRDSRVYLWDTSAVPAGTYWVYATASDGYNTSTRLAHRIVIDHNSAQDSTNPVLHVDIPKAGDPVAETLQVSGYAIDNVQIALVEVLVDNKLLGIVQPSLFNVNARSAYPTYADASAAGYNASFSLPATTSDSRQVKIIAYDTAGNSVTKSIKIGAGGSDGGGNSDVKLKTRLNLKARSLLVTIKNADQCSQITVVGHNKKSELTADPSVGTTLEVLAPTKSKIQLKAKKLKRLKRSKKKGNGLIFIGLLCDGTLEASRKVAATKVRTSRKIGTWQKYLQVLEKKL
ncbi:Ig-like domain-containing protein [Oligoflexia bacterium]|nr:Ig-like domain-containing protein [Oligoflexia bacterium]